MKLTRKKIFLALFAVSRVVLVVLLLWIWQTHVRHDQQNSKKILHGEIERTTTLIQSRMQLYVNGLYSIRALFASSPMVTRSQYHEYVESLNMLRTYPGLSAFAYIKRVPASQKDAFVSSVRRDTSESEVGYPDFHIFPESVRDEYMVLIYIEPFAGKDAALGFDVSSDPERVHTYEMARDTNREVLSGKVLGVLNANTVLLTVPVYEHGMRAISVEDRRTAFVGIINAGIRLDDFFASIFPENPLSQDKRVEIFDGDTISPEHLLFDNKPSEKGRTILAVETNSALVAGRMWTIRLTTFSN